MSKLMGQSALLRGCCAVIPGCGSGHRPGRVILLDRALMEYRCILVRKVLRVIPNILAARDWLPPVRFRISSINGGSISASNIWYRFSGAVLPMSCRYLLMVFCTCCRRGIVCSESTFMMSSNGGYLLAVGMLSTLTYLADETLIFSY